MDVSPLPDSINPNNFPAKLWRLVNNPANKAIFWDSHGEAIVIDRLLFERQILSPGTISSDSPDAFKTTNFSSFVRQLNLYGFKKADPSQKNNHHPAVDNGAYHLFYNPNFKRDHPELVASLRRLTVDNKAKIQAGLNVSCRPPSRYQRFSGGDEDRNKNVKRGCSSPFSPTHQESTHPYYLHKTLAMTAHSGTPVPPQYLMRGHGASLSPTVFATNNGMPVHLSHHYTGVASVSNVMHLQQSLLVHANHGNPNFMSFSPPNAPYHPCCSSTIFQCCQPNFAASQLTGSGLQTGLLSPHSYYQERYPVTMLGSGDHNQEPQHREHQEVKKCDINLDTIFQIADDVMQSPTDSCLVRVVTPEKTGPVFVLSSDTNQASTMQANPLYAEHIIMDESGDADVVTYKQHEESVLSVPEQVPVDAIFEVTSDDIEVSNTVAVTSHSQAYNSSSCAGSTLDI